MKPRVVFFAKVSNAEVLQRNEFYAVNLRILVDLGFETIVCTDPLRIPGADLYFVWWWTWAFFPLFRAKLAGKPIVITGSFDHVMPDGTWQHFGNRPFWHRWLMKLALREADANVFVSQLEYRHAQHDFAVRNPQWSYCAVDVNRYCPGREPREKFLLSFCWMKAENTQRKCVAEAISAASLLQRIRLGHRLVICGEKLDGYPALAAQVDRLGANHYVEFPGVVSRETKIELMQQCAVYLQPTRVEGFGLAIAEAMSCGAAVISSPAGAVPEVVGDAAILVDGTDPEAIASALAGLLADDRKREELGGRARARVLEMFSYERRKADLERIISDVMSGR